MMKRWAYKAKNRIKPSEKYTQQNGSNVDWIKFKKKRNEFNKKVRNAKYETWREFIEAVDDESI